MVPLVSWCVSSYTSQSLFFQDVKVRANPFIKPLGFLLSHLYPGQANLFHALHKYTWLNNAVLLYL